MPRTRDAVEREGGEDEDLARQPVDLLRQRRLLDRGGLEHAADVADLGVHAGRDDQDHPGPPRDLGVHERHVHAVAEGGIGSDGVDLLRGGDALAGERGLVDLQGRGREDARVGRNEVAGLEVDDVARDELVHREIDEIAVAAGLRGDGQLLAERIGGRGRLALLVQAHQGVAEREEQQHDPGEELPGQEEADDAGDEEHDLHGVGVLGQELLRARRLLRRGERVRADLGPARVGLGGGQTLVNVHALLAQCVVGSERKPGGGVRTGRGAGASWRNGSGHDFFPFLPVSFPVFFFGFAVFAASSASIGSGAAPFGASASRAFFATARSAFCAAPTTG